MDDKFRRQYDYKVNSNLVLSKDPSLVDKRPSNEATGEVQSLAGRLEGKMGDRAKTVTSSEASTKRKLGGPHKISALPAHHHPISVADIEIDDIDELVEESSENVGVILADDEDALSDDYLSEVHDSDDEFDLDEMFENAKTDSGIMNLEEISKGQTVIPKIEIGEPIRREGYQEYHISPVRRTPHTHEALLRIDELPVTVQAAFPDIRSLNLIQSAIYRRAIDSDKSLLICAPTGAGKTNIAILTMLREIMKHPNSDGTGFNTEKFKIVYVAPIKALVQEIVDNFTKKLGKSPFHIKVEELTGDHQLDQRQISRAQIIVCTPEKWDIVTRKSLDRLYTKVVKLVIFDEIHLLHNERGATLEALIARLKRHKEIEGESIRIVGLSATLPNYKDVARFIAPGKTEQDSVFYFDSSYRPIPLRQQYIALAESKKSFRIINDIVYERVIERLANHAQILIFVHSRQDTFKTADFIRCRAVEEQKIALFLSSESAVDKIQQLAKNVSPKLRELLQFGIGIHHAGLSKQERSSVEELFRSKFIRVLVSTATLAWGVNLPARTVIIKGTQVYRDGKWTDLDSLDVTQMLGRAGRPGFDKEGEGIVITQQSKVSFYMSLMNEQLPVESKLIGRLPEFINSECVIGNIESLEDAISWLSETYLSSRMLSVLHQPDNRQYLSLYGIKPEAEQNDQNLIDHKRNLAYSAACILDDRQLIVFDRNSGVMKATELGRIASHFNCSSRTTKLFYDSIHEHTSDTELLRTFSLADEFSEIFVRKGEETDLQVLINQVPFPIDDKRATPGANKVNALLQVYIFRLNLEGSDLICDMHFIKENAARLARAIYEVVLMKGHALVAEICLDLCRKIDRRMTVCHTPLRQFPDDLDVDIINKLERKNYQFDELMMLRADKLSELLRCDRFHAEKICKSLKYLPKLRVEANVRPVTSNCLKMDVTILPDFIWCEKYHGFVERFWLFVEDVNQERLLHHEMIHVRKYISSDKIRTSFFVPYLLPTHPFYFIRIFPDRWFGCDHHLPVYMERLNLPDEVCNFAQLLDLESQLFKAIDDKEFERYYQDKFNGANLNQIQTQAFRPIFQTNEDVIILASAGSGKTTCAELAIIRNIKNNKELAKSGFIAANSEAALTIYQTWQLMFGNRCGVYLLTGNHRKDALSVDSGQTNLVIGDPEAWYTLSLVRSKKHRKLMNKFQVFVFDDIHMLHRDKFSTLEWLCSKLRILTKLNPNPARIIALGSPMTGADSIRSWLASERGVKEPILLNYPPSIRPVKLELVIQKFNHYEYRMRLTTMQRPVYRLLTNSSRDRPVIIFVADYRQVLEVCETLVKYSRSAGRRFPHVRLDRSSVVEKSLCDHLQFGFGFIHQGMANADRRLVEGLFESKEIQVLVATVGTCWSISCRSYLTIIMDTQQHNGIEPVDYELTDVLQMIGLTGRPLDDHESKCIVMCQSSKAQLYERLLREPISVESNLPTNLIALINYEVATGSLTQLNNIYKPYIAHTLLYKRISINPNYYGVVLPTEPSQKSKIFLSFFDDLVNRVALDLEKSEFLTMDGGQENPDLSAGLLAKISLEYHINYETLANYSKWLSASSRTLNLKHLELIELIASNTVELDNIKVRHGELEPLKHLQRRHRPREGDQLHSSSFKIKLLLLSQYQKTDSKEDKVEGELVTDRYNIVNLAHRLLMTVIDVAWLKDSFALAKNAIQLAKKLLPFSRATMPSLDVETEIKRSGADITIEVTVTRANEPYSHAEFQDTTTLPQSLFRDEGWCFAVHGQPRLNKNDPDKFILFKRVKTPARGANDYKLELTLPDDASAYTYDLYFISDFYPVREDRMVPNIDVESV